LELQKIESWDVDTITFVEDDCVFSADIIEKRELVIVWLKEVHWRLISIALVIFL